MFVVIVVMNRVKESRSLLAFAFLLALSYTFFFFSLLFHEENMCLKM